MDTESDDDAEEDVIADLNLLNIPEIVELLVGDDPNKSLPSLDTLRSLLLAFSLALSVTTEEGLIRSDDRAGFGGGAVDELDLDDNFTGAAVNKGDDIEGSCSASNISLLTLLEDEVRAGFGGGTIGLVGGVGLFTVSTIGTEGLEVGVGGDASDGVPPDGVPYDDAGVPYLATGLGGDTKEGGDVGVPYADELIVDAGDAGIGVELSASISLARLVFFNFDRAPDRKEDSFTSTSLGDTTGDDLLGLLPVLLITGGVEGTDSLISRVGGETLVSTGEAIDRKTGRGGVGAGDITGTEGRESTGFETDRKIGLGGGVDETEVKD